MADRPDVSGRLASLSVPTLVVAGADDAIVSSTEMEGFARAIPNEEFVRIEQAGHMTPMENPKAFNEALTKFLRRTTHG
jgi:pimeloyl-ACP methyl ester carboxylesterase